MPTNFDFMLLKEKQAKILMALSDKSKKLYLTALAQAAGVTYVHTTRFISKCEKMGLVEAEKHGKIKSVYLTEKGMSVVSYMQNIIESMKNTPQKQEAKAAAATAPV